MKTCKINRKRRSTQCKRTKNKHCIKSTRSRKRRVRRNDMGRGLGSSKPNQITPPPTPPHPPTSSKNVTFSDQDQWEYNSQSPRSEEDFYYAPPPTRKHIKQITRKESLAKKKEKARAKGRALRGYEQREQEQKLLDFVTGRTTIL